MLPAGLLGPLGLLPGDRGRLSRHCSNSPTQHRHLPFGGQPASPGAGQPKRPPRARPGDPSPPGGAFTFFRKVWGIQLAVSVRPTA
eukprot:3205945-Amphidinium_carterae.1